MSDATPDEDIEVDEVVEDLDRPVPPEVPEADAIEQRQPLVDHGGGLARRGAGRSEASDADVLDQERDAGFDEDDEPR